MSILRDYAKDHPPDENEAAAPVPTEEEQPPVIEEPPKVDAPAGVNPAQIQAYKDSIMYQLENGQAPEIILYSALSLIGQIDPEWAMNAIDVLTAMYSDLQQQCLFWNGIEEAQQRLDAKQQKAVAMAQKSLDKRGKVYRELLDILLKEQEQLDSLKYNWESD